MEIIADTIIIVRENSVKITVNIVIFSFIPALLEFIIKEK